MTGARKPLEDVTIELGDLDSSSESEDDEEDSSSQLEIQQIIIEIAEVVNCLYRLSMSVRNPTGTQRYIKSAHIDTSFFEPFDVEHVNQKFPQAMTYLVERLGKAISRRRQYLKYRETHAAKIAQHLPPFFPEDSGTVLSETTASALLAHNNPAEEVKSVAASESSYATSAGSVHRIRMPSMPRAARYGLPFECPYCRTIECVKDTNAWNKHVYRDLQPYICTFEKCTTSSEMYESRRQWFNHELHMHRRSWVCNGHCDHRFASSEALLSHIQKFYPGQYSDAQLPIVVQMWAGPMENHANSACPLCLENITGTIQLQKHLGRHLEEIALFSLPNDRFESDDEDDSEIASKESTRDASIIDPDSVYCSECSSLVQIHYHCSICDDGDFDVCEDCYARGIRCWDEKHMLLKRGSAFDQFSKKHDYESAPDGHGPQGILIEGEIETNDVTVHAATKRSPQLATEGPSGQGRRDEARHQKATDETKWRMDEPLLRDDIELSEELYGYTAGDSENDSDVRDVERDFQHETELGSQHQDTLTYYEARGKPPPEGLAGLDEMLEQQAYYRAELKEAQEKQKANASAFTNLDRYIKHQEANTSTTDLSSPLENVFSQNNSTSTQDQSRPNDMYALTEEGAELGAWINKVVRKHDEGARVTSPPHRELEDSQESFNHHKEGDDSLSSIQTEQQSTTNVCISSRLQTATARHALDEQLSRSTTPQQSEINKEKLPEGETNEQQGIVLNPSLTKVHSRVIEPETLGVHDLPWEWDEVGCSPVWPFNVGAHLQNMGTNIFSSAARQLYHSRPMAIRAGAERS